MRALAALAVLLLADVTPRAPVDGICTGCKASAPAGTDPVPLVVVLHGDWGVGPTDLLAAWEKHAAKRNMAVLALKCPVDLGCKGSWWQWNGDPAWVSQQVDAFAKKRAIDRNRVYLAGWSGGASYIGMRAQAFQAKFAAIVYHGGGVAPVGACAASSPTPAPAYFLVGSGNPLHSLAVDLRKHNEGCGVDVTWKLLPGADHTAEWKALDTYGGAIADWMLTKKR
jgi:poly(3-hydroxybutyrate) depolymerase